MKRYMVLLLCVASLSSMYRIPQGLKDIMNWEDELQMIRFITPLVLQRTHKDNINQQDMDKLYEFFSKLMQRENIRHDNAASLWRQLTIFNNLPWENPSPLKKTRSDLLPYQPTIKEQPPLPPLPAPKTFSRFAHPMPIVSSIDSSSVPKPAPLIETPPLELLAKQISEKYGFATNLQFPLITFKDIEGGIPEEIEGLKNFLENDKYFLAVGAKKPGSILLYGPPGTGKTMLVKAIAGELKVPLLYVAGSEFINKFVGVGADTVRKLFDVARALSKIYPHMLIFIDEIDAIGKREDDGGSGASESNRTITQLMTCLDGKFDEPEMRKITLLAATNKPENIDEALVRSKRFDEQIEIPLPTFDKRLAVFRHYLYKTPRKFDIMLDQSFIQKIAEESEGFNCADLETVVNNAAGRAGLKKRGLIPEDFTGALQKILERKPKMKESSIPYPTMYS